MGKIGIGDRLNANSKKNIIFAKDYRKVRLDPRTLIPSEHNKYSQDNIEELADNMLLVRTATGNHSRACRRARQNNSRT